MQWFQVKEQSAGKKRLVIMWYMYKIFGKKILYTIAFFVAFFTFLLAPKVREYSKKYFIAVEKYTNIKPSLKNIFKHIYFYAFALVDKMLVFCGDFDLNRISFNNEDDEKLFLEQSDKGAVFVFSHIGNIELLQGFLLKNIKNPDFKINIFISNRQSQIFNSFLNKIKSKMPIKLFEIEKLGMSSGIELQECLDKGDFLFIAGDRLSENNSTKCIEAEIFDKKILLPDGTFKLLGFIDAPVYFISVLKSSSNYKVYTEKQNALDKSALIESYINFLERNILKSPYEFYHFYDFFN